MLYNEDQHAGSPRASRIHLPPQVISHTVLWMGGARSAVGDDIHPASLANAWVIDCARDMPATHLDASAKAFHRVFIDSEDIPPNYPRIAALAESLGEALGGRTPRPGAQWEHPAEPPEHLFVMCTYGLNRSGLMMGRILRALGLPGDEAVAAIRAARPGALANFTYERIVRE